MNNKTKNYCKWGIAFAIVWNVFILGFYSLMCLSEGVPFTENIEVDSWIGFYFCYALATTVWFYIGYGLRKEYVTKKESHLSAYGNSGESEKNFKLDFIRQYIKLLLSFFHCIDDILYSYAYQRIQQRDIYRQHSSLCRCNSRMPDFQQIYFKKNRQIKFFEILPSGRYCKFGFRKSDLLENMRMFI